jgi:ABC-2 type transport system ATP-binding protein
VIELVNLHKSFGEFTAVKSLNISVPKGELYGFLGPNGAGKTTTVKMITGLLKPSGGTVKVGPHDVNESPEKAKRITGYIPDSPYVYPQLTMTEYLNFVRDLYNLDPERSGRIRDEYYERFNLGNWHQDLVRNLSHGMKQKMLFTAIFMMEPEVIVIDEPMVGLDPQSARVFKQSLRNQVDDKETAIFLSTHSLEVAQEICDRIGILRQGELIAEGTYRELRDRDDESLEEVFLRVTREKTSKADTID